MLIPLESPDDPRIEEYRQVREGELVKRRGLFIAEGSGVVRVLLQRSPFRVRSLLLAPARAVELAPELSTLDPAVPVYVGPAELLERIVGFDLHRGVLALGERGAERSLESLAAPRAGGPLVLLEALANHDNVGAIFRNAAALGAGGVLLDPRTADPLYRKAIRVSMGTALWLPFARAARWPEALDRLKLLGYRLVALTPAAEAGSITCWPGGQDDAPLALLLGSEGPGLEPATLARADHRLRIPMAAGVDSLNVATAAAVALYALGAGRVQPWPAGGGGDRGAGR